MALSRHLWRLFPPEFYPQTLTYIKLCSNITEYLTVNAFEKTQNTHPFDTRLFAIEYSEGYSSKLDIGGKIWHQGKNSKSEISSSFRTTRDTNERERLHTIISREQQQQQIGSVSLRCFLRLENPLGIRLISRRDQ